MSGRSVAAIFALAVSLAASGCNKTAAPVAAPLPEVVVGERKVRAAQPSAVPAAAPQGRKKSDR